MGSASTWETCLARPLGAAVWGFLDLGLFSFCGLVVGLVWFWFGLDPFLRDPDLFGRFFFRLEWVLISVGVGFRLGEKKTIQRGLWNLKFGVLGSSF